MESKFRVYEFKIPKVDGDKDDAELVIFHFGETDQSIPKEHWERIKAAHPKIPMHIYQAGHGFACDERASYNADSTRLARQRTIDFFRQHIG